MHELNCERSGHTLRFRKTVTKAQRGSLRSTGEKSAELSGIRRPSAAMGAAAVGHDHQLVGLRTTWLRYRESCSTGKGQTERNLGRSMRAKRRSMRSKAEPKLSTVRASSSPRLAYFAIARRASRAQWRSRPGARAQRTQRTRAVGEPFECRIFKSQKLKRQPPAFQKLTVPTSVSSGNAAWSKDGPPLVLAKSNNVAVSFKLGIRQSSLPLSSSASQ